MERKTDYYGYTDVILKYLTDEIREKYAPLKSILNIDQLNLLTQKNIIADEVYALIRRTFLVIGRYYYKLYFRGVRDNVNFYKAMTGREAMIERDLESLSEQWVDELLESVDEVAKVSFHNEFDRKNSVLYEALVVSPTPAAEVDALVKRLVLMLNTFGIRITDEAVLKAYADKGETEVRWNAEMDNKTCGICEERNGRVYRIKDLPPKPHFNCRCWFTLVR